MKRFITGLLCAALTVSLVACGKEPAPAASVTQAPAVSQKTQTAQANVPNTSGDSSVETGVPMPEREPAVFMNFIH